MRAATHVTYGPPSVLRVTEIAPPEPGPADVLIDVRASEVTQGDRRLRAADFPGITALFGRLMIGVRGPREPVGGSTFAGRVVSVGAEVTRLSVGDDVFGVGMRGAWAERLAFPAGGAIARMPAGASYAEAATIPYGAGTALTFLRDRAKVLAGERVLVVGATGGVGRYTVQVARHLGAEVTGVGSRDLDLVRALGAAHVIDHTREDYRDGGERYDVIFDTTEGGRFWRARAALARGGRYVSLHVTVGMLAAMAATTVFRGKRAITGVAVDDAELLEAVRGLVEEGALRPVIAERYPLDGIAAAHTSLEARRPRGSVVIDVAGAPHDPTAPIPAELHATRASAVG